ncbi:hypothetical protein [Actinospongicola halichondriae]|uniref:hypothetical protein n=1 Tax=Actinospongicola halichondriae TaxID=3236844 RepID=UPI003D391A30
MRRFVVILITSLLGLTACGGDSGPGLDEYADALAEGILADDNDDSLDTTDDEAHCIGDATAPIIGLDALEEAGTPEEVTELAEDDLSAFDLSDGKAIDIATATFDCVDGIVDQLIESFETGSDDIDQCLADELEDAQLIPLLAISLKGADVTEEDTADLTETLVACSGGDDGDEERLAYESALTSFLMSDAAGELGDTEATCIASEALGIIGRDRTVALGTPDEFVAATTDDLDALELTDQEIIAVADAYIGCAPGVVDELRTAFVAGTGITGEPAVCLTEAVDDYVAAQILALSLSGADRPAILQSLQSTVQTCA